MSRFWAMQIILFPLVGQAQSFDLGTWNVFTLKYNINNKCSLLGEAQLRSLKFYDQFHYFERNRMLVAFVYKPTMATSILIGYLHQFDYKINDETGRDFLNIGYSIDLFRKTSSNSAADTGMMDN